MSETLRLFGIAYAIGAECARAGWEVASREDRAGAETWMLTPTDYEGLHAELPESDVKARRDEMRNADEHAVTGCDDWCEHPDPETASARHARAEYLEREAARGYREELRRLAETKAPSPCGGDCAGCG